MPQSGERLACLKLIVQPNQSFLRSEAAGGTPKGANIMYERKDKNEFIRNVHRSINGPEQTRPRARKRKFSKTLIVLTAVIQIAVSMLICWGLLINGPFGTIRRYVIGTAMSTYSHQFIAKMLFPQKQIEAVIKEASDESADSQDLSKLKSGDYLSSDVTLSEISSQNGSFHGYLLEIANPLRVKVAYTRYIGKVGETTSQMAKDHDALAAVNGGGFSDGGSWTGTGALPTDYIISGGKVVWKSPGYSEAKVKNLPISIALDNTGTLIVGQHTINELLGLGVQYAVTMSGYKPLVVNGKGMYKDDGGRGYQPRTVIGQKADKTILLLVLDGRTIGMKGASLLDAQKIMLDHGAVTAANLDGGNSTTMYYNGNVVNHPSGDYGERTVATSFYVEK
jgi:exopolysaccharide biosynthesis protein